MDASELRLITEEGFMEILTTSPGPTVANSAFEQSQLVGLNVDSRTYAATVQNRALKLDPKLYNLRETLNLNSTRRA